MTKTSIRARSAARKQSSAGDYNPKDKFAPREQTYFAHIHDVLRDRWEDDIENFVSREESAESDDRRAPRPARHTVKRPQPRTAAVAADEIKTGSSGRKKVKGGTMVPAAATSPATTIDSVPFERRKIDDLNPFPLQSQYYGQESEADDASLEQKLRVGQTELIPVMPYPNRAGLPNGTLLDGHRRWAIWKKIGTKRIKIVVRSDLADAEMAQIEAAFLSYNFDRRQLHIIDKARIAKRLHEIEKGRSRGGLDSWEDSEARERVGKQIGMSGRELQRYWRVLKSPDEVHEAVRRGRLTLTLGEKVCALPEEQQAEIVEHVRGNLVKKSKDKREERLLKAELTGMVAAYFKRDNDNKNPFRALGDFCCCLHRGVSELGPMLRHIPIHNFKGMKAEMREYKRLINRIIDLADKAESAPD